MFRLPLLLSIAVAILSSGPAWRQAVHEPKVYPISQIPADLRPTVQRGDLIIISLQATMLSELSRELETGGPIHAVNSCHIDTTGDAYRLARQQGVTVGRTSDRLRHPINAPRPWAAGIVKQYAGSKAANIDGFAVDLGDRVGLLRPIAHRPICSGCHGKETELDPRVRALLKERYPHDRAVGFVRGELRGWFWAEVPKK
jgi:hypothetical protein